MKKLFIVLSLLVYTSASAATYSVWQSSATIAAAPRTNMHAVTYGPFDISQIVYYPQGTNPIGTIWSLYDSPSNTVGLLIGAHTNVVFTNMPSITNYGYRYAADGLYYKLYTNPVTGVIYSNVWPAGQLVQAVTNVHAASNFSARLLVPIGPLTSTNDATVLTFDPPLRVLRGAFMTNNATVGGGGQIWIYYKKD